jgi:hypothetical protein
MWNIPRIGVVRHIYRKPSEAPGVGDFSFKFNRTLIKPLATRVEALFEQISKELRAFASFLKSSGST